jgi:hypothetical protein
MATPPEMCTEVPTLTNNSSCTVPWGDVVEKCSTLSNAEGRLNGRSDLTANVTPCLAGVNVDSGSRAANSCNGLLQLSIRAPFSHRLSRSVGRHSWRISGRAVAHAAVDPQPPRSDASTLRGYGCSCARSRPLRASRRLPVKLRNHERQTGHDRGRHHGLHMHARTAAADVTHGHGGGA